MTQAPVFTRRTLASTADFQRILNIPRRTPTPEEMAALVQRLNPILKTPEGTWTLKPVQAWALYELGTNGGLFAPIRVSGGKTLISLLAPFVTQAKVPLLIVPAGLKEKTEIARMQMSKHFRVAKHMRVMSYEQLGRENQAKEIEYYRPDLIICDEVHKLKNLKAGVTRRVKRYMAKDPRTKQPWSPEERPKFVGMSGTMLGGGSIKTFAHFLRWCLNENAPIPSDDGELEELASCLDEAANFLRPSPGPWLKLASEQDQSECQGDELKLARRGFQRRLIETPGVVSTAGEQVNCSLYIRGHVYHPNATTDENFKILRGEPEDKERKYPGWETPDGWPLTMAAETWRVARELALGFHGVWDPRPPPEWLARRKAWAAFVREVLSRSRTLDTEKQVALACSKGELSRLEYDAWLKIKDSFRIVPKDIWHDTAALEECEKWMKKGPGIVWVEHIFFGEELERRTGAPYFREHGNDRGGRNLEALSELIKAGKAKAGPIIASAFSCQAGFNLQPWARNLLPSCPSGAKTLEQLIGRTHREYQMSDQVEVDILFGCVEHFESWENAIAQAHMAEDSLGDLQKILMADVIMPPMPRDGYRWNRAARSTNLGRNSDGTPWWERGLEVGSDD